MANNLTVTGNLAITGSSVFTGTVDLAGGALNTDLVTNFNADLLDSAHKDTDGTLSGNSDSSIPTEKAVKTYADTKVALAGDQTVAGVKTFSDKFIGSAQILYIEDQKAENTNGGTSVTKTWTQRNLNTVVTNSISGASLASNRITLPAGTYFVEASAPAAMANMHILKLYNYTDSTDILIGTAEFCPTAYFVVTRSHVKGVFTLAAQKVIELRHNVYIGYAATGFGVGENSDFGVIEVYSQIEIRKIA